MVFYFKSSAVTPPALFYMGKDKYENEDLIKFGWPEDIWFHVHNYSSAHVYLRLPKGQNINDIPAEVVTDAVQLVKANSIQGNKLNNIDVVYTPWDNIKKTAGMEAGQVAFFSEDKVIKVRVEKRINDIINRLNKTKTEEYPDLRQQREQRDHEERQEKKQLFRKQQEKEKEEAKQRELEAELKSYATLHKSENMHTNQDDGNDSDDFM